MKVKTKELKDKLNLLYKHIGKGKSGGIVSKYFIFDKNRILTINEEYCFEIPFETSISVMLMPDEIIKIVNGIKEEDCVIKVKDNFLVLKTSKTKTKISCFENDKELLKQLPEISDWKKVPNNFNRGVKLTVFSTSRDIYKSAYNSLHINKTLIESTDNYRVSRFEMSKSMPEFLLPSSSAELLSNHNTLKYRLDKNWIHFENEDESILHCKIVDAKFPNTSKLFEEYKSCEFFELPKDLMDVIDLVGVLAEGEYLLEKRVFVQIEGGIMKCKAENESGWITSQTQLDTDKDVEFMINPVFMREILKTSSMASIVDKMIIFKLDNFVHIMMTFVKKGERE